MLKRLVQRLAARPLLAVLAALLVSGSAIAGSVIAFTVYATRYVPQTSAPPNCVPGYACVYVSSADNNLYYVNPSGLTTNISGTVQNGIASSYNSASVASQNTLTMSPTLGSVVLNRNGSGLGTLLDVEDSTTSPATHYLQVSATGLNQTGPFNFGNSAPLWWFLQNATVATGGAPQQGSPDVDECGAAWDGAASRSVCADLWTHPVTTGSSSYTADFDVTLYRAGVAASSPDLRLTWNGTSHTATFAGNFSLPTNWTAATSGTAATNTTGASWTTSVTDGSSTIDFLWNASTSTANGVVAQFNNNSSLLLKILPYSPSFPNDVMLQGNGVGKIIIGNNSGSEICYSTDCFASHVNVASPEVIVAGTSVWAWTGTKYYPETDLSYAIGDTTHRMTAVYSRHYVGGGAAPTSSEGTGAGTSPSGKTIAGSDYNGTYAITTGTTPASTATLTTITFAATWDSAPNCHVWPATTATMALASGAQPQVTASTTTTFTITTGGTALAGSTAYKWGWECTQPN